MRCSASAVHTGSGVAEAPGRSANSTGAGRSGSGSATCEARSPHHTGRRCAGHSGAGTVSSVSSPRRAGRALPTTRTSSCSTSLRSRLLAGGRSP